MSKPTSPVGANGPWRWLRRLTQLLLPVAVLVAPLLGGWQRLDRNHLAAWDGHGWDLPPRLVDLLPLGEAPARAYDSIVLAGGGSAAEYFSVPVVDPVAGTLAFLFTDGPASRTLLALGLVLVAGLLTGRMFCGWFCPFGTLARGLEMALERLPWQPPRYSIPRRRPMRFVLLGVAVLAGALGSHTLLWLALPHLLVEQAAYGIWLMGGAGAALGALMGLVAAGLFFGPTTYCATLCPTGAALATLGRKRPVRLTIVNPVQCGKHCDLCDHGCWISLLPSTGDPGPDCDACGRCTEVCPHENLEVGFRGTIRPRVAVAAALLLGLLASGCGEPEKDRLHPRLVLDSVRQVDGVDLGIGVVDLSGIELDANDGEQLEGREVSVYLARGHRPEPDPRGKETFRETYSGPLELVVQSADGARETLSFERPNYPISTPNRTIYRRKVEIDLRAGSSLTLAPVPTWTTEPQVWEVPSVVSAGTPRFLGHALAGGLLFAGLMSLALGWTRPGS